MQVVQVQVFLLFSFLRTLKCQLLKYMFSYCFPPHTLIDRIASKPTHQIRRQSNYVARTDCRSDRTNCNYRHPTIIPFRPHHVPIIGFKCMTSSYGPRFQWASCGGDEFSVAIYPFVRLIWQLSNLKRAIWHGKILWGKCALLWFFGFSDKCANGLFDGRKWMKCTR